MTYEITQEDKTTLVSGVKNDVPGYLENHFGGQLGEIIAQNFDYQAYADEYINGFVESVNEYDEEPDAEAFLGYLSDEDWDEAVKDYVDIQAVVAEVAQVVTSYAEQHVEYEGIPYNAVVDMVQQDASNFRDLETDLEEPQTVLDDLASF